MTRRAACQPTRTEVCFPDVPSLDPRTPRGFTLIELIVVIGVIAILIGLMLPALSQSMVSAKRTRAAATLRQAHLLVSMYTQQSKDVYPIANDGVVGAGLEWYKPVIAAGLANQDRDIDPAGTSINKAVTIAMSEALAASSEFFNPEATSWSLDFASSPVRVSDVVYASEKGELYYWWVGFERIRTFWCCLQYRPAAPFSKVDGSIADARWTDFQITPDRNPSTGMGTPIIRAWGGSKGRDVLTTGR
jgi:prepilin-type N-terminal cleavage/methylation domain-containing protein